MLVVENLAGQQEPLSEFKQYNRTRKVNGEKTISMTVIPSEHNEYSFPMIEEESKVIHGDDAYVLKKLNGKAVGHKTIKRVDGIHKFYVDLINKQQTKIHNGSITFNDYMNLVFEGTGYTFAAVDSFNAREFDNLGNDNRLALLSKGLDRFKSEMELAGTQVRFKKQIGNDADFQFRYGHNIKAIDRSVDTKNLATVIRGTGDEGITAYYRSPNADIFGEIDAPSVNDERFKTEESLLDEMKSRLEDTPEFSITIDFVDLRAAGYPYTVPNEGDRVFVIYEPMNDLLLETRIMEINETFNADLEPVKTTVTLANYKKTFAGTMFDNVQKQLRKITNEDGIVKSSVLEEAVRIATETIVNDNANFTYAPGYVLGVNVDDPNLLTRLTSQGFGVSSDGGKTFPNAITGRGIVAEMVMAGLMQGVNIIQDDGDGGVIELVNGVLQTYLNNSRVMRVNENGLTMFLGSNGGEAGTLRDSQLTSDTSKKGFSLNSAKDFIGIGFGSAGGTATPIIRGVKNEYTSVLVQMNGTNISMLRADVIEDVLWLYYKLKPYFGSRFEVDSDLKVFGYVSATDFQDGSRAEIKDRIKIMDQKALEILNDADIHEFYLRSELEKGIENKKYGFIIGDGYKTPDEVITLDGNAISAYSHRSLNTKAIQELSQENEELKNEVGDLKNIVNDLVNRIEELENAK